MDTPKLSALSMYRLLSRWSASADFERLRWFKGYRAHCDTVFNGNKPWGWPPMLGYGGFVYFARDCTGSVKVGVSDNPKARMASIGGSAQLLLVVSSCGRPHEQALHRLLEPDNTTGEWFQGDLTESLIRFLLAAASGKEHAA